MQVQDREAGSSGGRFGADPNSARWWVLVGATAAAGVAIALLPAVILEFAVYLTPMEDFPWVLVVAIPFAIAGWVTAVVGGVRSWLRLAPVVAALGTATFFLMLDEPPAGMYLSALWVVIVLGTAVGRMGSQNGSDRGDPGAG